MDNNKLYNPLVDGKFDIDEVVGRAKEKAGTMKVDNSRPLMTHDIEKDGCDGMKDCAVCFPLAHPQDTRNEKK